MGDLRLYARSLLLAAAATVLLACIGWGVRYRIAVEVHLALQGRTLGFRLRENLGANAIAHVCHILSSDANPERRRRAALLLGAESNRHAIPSLIDALQDSDAKVQLQAFDALRRDSRWGYPDWMVTVPDERLVAIVRQTKDADIRCRLFLGICWQKRSAMLAAGEALLTGTPAPSGDDLSRCLQYIEGGGELGPADRGLYCRFALLGVDDPDWRARLECRDAVVRSGAINISERQLLEWEAAFRVDPWGHHQEAEARVLAELARRDQASVAQAARDALANEEDYEATWQLIDLLPRFLTPSQEEEVLRAGLQNQTTRIHDILQKQLDSPEFQERLRAGGK